MGAIVRWEFKQDSGSARLWRWQCVDIATGSVLKSSAGKFNSLFECLSDAEKNGYNAAATWTVTEPAQRQSEDVPSGDR